MMKKCFIFALALYFLAGAYQTADAQCYRGRCSRKIFYPQWNHVDSMKNDNTGEKNDDDGNDPELPNGCDQCAILKSGEEDTIEHTRVFRRSPCAIRACRSTTRWQYSERNVTDNAVKEDDFPTEEESEPEPTNEIDVVIESQDADADTESNDDVHSYETELIRTVNEHRMNAGLHPLTIRKKGCLLARIHSSNMARSRYIFHAGGYTECVANSSGESNHVVELWLNSLPHRSIIMSPNVTTIAVGSFGPWHTLRVW